jgi:hypothetical protein
MDTISQFPAGLVYNPQDLADPSIDADILTVRMLLQITHLQNLFLLERLLLRHGAPDEGDLLITTFEIVTLTLTFWTQKDRFSQVRRYFEWLVRPQEHSLIALTNNVLVDGFRRTRRWNPMPRTPTTNLSLEAPQR